MLFPQATILRFVFPESVANFFRLSAGTRRRLRGEVSRTVVGGLLSDLMGRDRAVVRLPGGDSPGDLHDQCSRVAAHDVAQGDQNPGLVPQRRIGTEVAVSGAAKRFQAMEAGAELANGAEPFHPAPWRSDGGGLE